MQMVRSRRSMLSIPSYTWALTMLIVVLLVAFNFRQFMLETNSPLASEQVETFHRIVIATQEIAQGTVITDEMIGLITLSDVDMAELRITQPGRELLADTADVLGQTSAVNIYWFQPIEAALLGEPIDPCSQVSCPQVPEGFYTINFSLNDTAQGLTVGDHVDMLAVVDDELTVIVQNILLTELQSGTATLAAPSWQHSILVWLYRTEQPYAFRLHMGEQVKPEDTTPVEYVFTSPEALPEDYQFDLIVGLPVSEGYLLTDLPASIDAIPYTEDNGSMQFWFKNLEVVTIENNTEVTIRLSNSDAENLDYLINLGASLSFRPDEDPAR